MYQAWKRLWPFLRPYGSAILLTFVLGLFLAQLTVVVPAMAKFMVNAFKGETLLDDKKVLLLIDFFGLNPQHWFFQQDHKQLVYNISIYFPLHFLVFGLIRYSHFFLVKYIGEKVISDIRVALMDKFMALDVLYSGRQSQGSASLLSRTLNDTLVLQQGLQYYADLIREPITGLILIVFLFFNNWKITLACFVFLPIFAAVIRYVSKSLKAFGHESQKSLEEVTNILKEGLDGMRVIQSFNLQEKMKTRFKGQVKEYLGTRKKIISQEELGSPLNEWFASFLICGVCIFQGEMIWAGESDVGSFIAFLAAAGALNSPVKKTQQAFIRIQQNIVAVERLDEILSAQTQVVEKPKPSEFPSNWQEIQFKDVSFSYLDKPVVKNLNLTIKKGEVVALVGQSGSGKSTLAGLLQRFFDPQTGNVLVGGVDISEMKMTDLRHQIGYVTQDVFLFNDSIKKNIAYGNLDRSMDDVPEAARTANAEGFILEKPGAYEAQVGERGGNFSGGEKQRISIARAIFKDPPLLILDEATSALDSASEQEVQKGIDRLLEGRTALVIAHRLSTIKNCDRIVVMKDGEIVEQGKHNDLIEQNSEYARFYKLQYQT